MNGLELQTDRLRLRHLIADDAIPMQPALNNFEISKWLQPVPFPYGMDDAVWFIGHTRDSDELVWVVDDGGFAGLIGMDSEFGYWLAQDRWGCGYATEAGRAVLDWHFTDGTGHDLGSGYFAGNARSGRVLAKLGFTDTGIAMMPCRARGEQISSHLLLLTRDAWLTHRAPPS